MTAPAAAARIAASPALSARAALHWRGRLVELILPALSPLPEDATARPAGTADPAATR